MASTSLLCCGSQGSPWPSRRPSIRRQTTFLSPSSRPLRSDPTTTAASLPVSPLCCTANCLNRHPPLPSSTRLMGPCLGGLGWAGGQAHRLRQCLHDLTRCPLVQHYSQDQSWVRSSIRWPSTSEISPSACPCPCPCTHLIYSQQVTVNRQSPAWHLASTALHTEPRSVSAWLVRRHCRVPRCRPTRMSLLARLMEVQRRSPTVAAPESSTTCTLRITSTMGHLSSWSCQSTGPWGFSTASLVYCALTRWMCGSTGYTRILGLWVMAARQKLMVLSACPCSSCSQGTWAKCSRWGWARAVTFWERQGWMMVQCRPELLETKQKCLAWVGLKPGPSSTQEQMMSILQILKKRASISRVTSTRFELGAQLICFTAQLMTVCPGDNRYCSPIWCCPTTANSLLITSVLIMSNRYSVFCRVTQSPYVLPDSAVTDSRSNDLKSFGNLQHAIWSVSIFRVLSSHACFFLLWGASVRPTATNSKLNWFSMNFYYSRPQKNQVGKSLLAGSLNINDRISKANTIAAQQYNQFIYINHFFLLSGLAAGLV